jgi:hypothetical protein
MTLTYTTNFTSFSTRAMRRIRRTLTIRMTLLSELADSVVPFVIQSCPNRLSVPMQGKKEQRRNAFGTMYNWRSRKDHGMLVNESNQKPDMDVNVLTTTVRQSSMYFRSSVNTPTKNWANTSTCDQTKWQRRQNYSGNSLNIIEFSSVQTRQMQ